MTTLQYSEYYLVTTIYPDFSGVTKQNIKMQKTSEIQPISEVFRFPQTAFRRRIWRMVKNLCMWNKNLTFADINELRWKRILT